MVDPVTAPARLRLVAVMTQVHVAFPVASEISILPSAGEPFLSLNVQTTSRFAVGDMVPIPTFPHHVIGLLF